ncbi:MAG: DJ-1/PfpI family protein [Treponema sp.]|nr:DJ-1/PfpI family protein [Treponema sp.]MCL2237095.1 DJ-1/PfpI family protein [Treponema sp.]
MKKAIVLLADGFEEVEAVTPIDYLRRAGVEVATVSVSGNMTITGRWTGIKMIADTSLLEIVKQNAMFDAVVIPGGLSGAENIAASKEAGEFIKLMADAGKVIAAICASPAIVLAPLGIISGKKFTCYPGMEEKTDEGTWKSDRVVIDGNLITSRGAGTAGEWSIAIIKELLDEAAGNKIAETVLL